MSRTTLLVGLAFVAFISLGLPDGLLGVAWPSIRASFGLPLDALGLVLVTGGIGYMTASFSSGMLLVRMSVGTLLALSCLATAVALAGYAVAPAWLVVVAFGLLSGLGAGAIDAGLNTYVAQHYSARTLNWLHACYGIGATIGPALMTAVLAAGRPWQQGYLLVAAAQLVLALAFAGTRHWWGHAPQPGNPAARPVPPAPAVATLRLPATWLSILVFCAYTGLEVSAGQWSYTLFTESRGVSPTAAGAWVSVYWGSLTAGRVLIGFLADRWPATVLLRACLVAATLGTALLWQQAVPVLGVAGLALIGFALAPIFPTLIHATPGRLGPAHTANAVGFQVASAMVGAALVPGAVGSLAGALGLEAIGPALLGVALVLTICHELLARQGAAAIPVEQAGPA